MMAMKTWRPRLLLSFERRQGDGRHRRGHQDLSSRPDRRERQVRHGGRARGGAAEPTGHARRDQGRSAVRRYGAGQDAPVCRFSRCRRSIGARSASSAAYRSSGVESARRSDGRATTPASQRRKARSRFGRMPSTSRALAASTLSRPMRRTLSPCAVNASGRAREATETPPSSSRTKPARRRLATIRLTVCGVSLALRARSAASRPGLAPMQRQRRQLRRRDAEVGQQPFFRQPVRRRGLAQQGGDFAVFARAVPDGRRALASCRLRRRQNRPAWRVLAIFASCGVSGRS